MSKRKYNPRNLERDATQNMSNVPRKIQGLEGFKVLPGVRKWEEEQTVNGERVKVTIRVQSLDLDRSDDQAALEPGDARDNYDSDYVQTSESNYGPNRFGATYLLPKRRV